MAGPSARDLLDALLKKAEATPATPAVAEPAQPEDIDLTQISAADFLAALEAQEEAEKTASEIVRGLTDEQLQNLAQTDPDTFNKLAAAVEAEEAPGADKTAALMGGEFDDVALAGYVWGQAAQAGFYGIDLAKQAEEDIDLTQISAADFLAALEAQEEAEKTASAGDVDLTQISAAHLLELIEAAEAEEAAEKTAGAKDIAAWLASKAGKGVGHAQVFGRKVSGAVSNSRVGNARVDRIRKMLPPGPVTSASGEKALAAAIKDRNRARGAVAGAAAGTVAAGGGLAAYLKQRKQQS